ncbi:uncharacterized protein [Elaeis guineensis]|uniref:uncharacterized protein n=1 Tax=Elaeis guineensis var. tenera TaxID=51953 RepID=UPI003C6CCFD3
MPALKPSLDISLGSISRAIQKPVAFLKSLLKIICQGSFLTELAVNGSQSLSGNWVRSCPHHCEGKPDLRKKVMSAIIVRQRDPWHRKDGVYMYFEDNAGVIVEKGAGRRCQVFE